MLTFGTARGCQASAGCARCGHDLAKIPGNEPHALKGDRKGYWAVSVKANWRIIFRFADGDALSVELLDYH